MRIRCAIAGLAALLAGCSDIPSAPGAIPAEYSAGRWELFSVDRMRSRRAQEGSRYYQAMADSSFRMGLLGVPAGASPLSLRHGEDAVYLIVGGAAQLVVAGLDFDVEAGSVLYLRSNQRHQFQSITSDLDAILAFPRGDPVSGGADLAVFTIADMAGARDSEQAVYAPLLDTSAMTLGVYMLPEGGGGEIVSAHAEDELKIVVNGSGRFDLGDGGTEVAPGSIAFIQRGLPHRFGRVSTDLDVLTIRAR